MNTLTKKRIVLDLSHPESDYEGLVLYSPEGDPGLNPSLFLGDDDWSEMGEPRQVTVTVEPGDLLNDEA